MLITDFLDDVFYYGLLLCLKSYSVHSGRKDNLLSDVPSNRVAAIDVSSSIPSTSFSFPTPLEQQLALLLDIGYIKEFYYFENSILCTRYTISKFGIEFLLCNMDETLRIYEFRFSKKNRTYVSPNFGTAWTEDRPTVTDDNLYILLSYLPTEKLPRFLVHEDIDVRSTAVKIIDERSIHENLVED